MWSVYPLSQDGPWLLQNAAVTETKWSTIWLVGRDTIAIAFITNVNKTTVQRFSYLFIAGGRRDVCKVYFQQLLFGNLVKEMHRKNRIYYYYY